jgi:ribonuclease HI/ADP-ribose pyrophosphatase YjhB (NUDIX family)
MKQKISVRAIIRHKEKMLLLRRATGRESIQGFFELPGGSIDFREQPEDALRRYLRTDLEIEAETVQLQDSIGFVDPDDPMIHYVFIVFAVSIDLSTNKLSLGQKYDKYVWQSVSELQHNLLTNSTKILLGIQGQQEPSLELAKEKTNYDVTKTSNNHLIVYSDGGSRGNPGPSASGFVVLDDMERMIAEGGAYIGVTTNNQAEYQAIYLGLQKALEIGAKTIDFRMDSLLAVNQLNGTYKIKNRDLWPIYERVKELTKEFERVTFTHVRREFNQLADAMVNKLLDQQQARADQQDML